MFKIIEGTLYNRKTYGVAKGNHMLKDISYSRESIERLVDWLNSKSLKDEEIYAATDGYFTLQAYSKYEIDEDEYGKICF